MTEGRSITQLFEFLARNDLRSIEKHEICSTKFSVLRRSLRLMIILLREDGDEEGRQLSDRLRALLSRWLTTPIEFDHSLLESLETIGAGAGLETRWGAQVGTAYKAACEAARELAGTPNPLREKLEELVEGLSRGGGDYRIYCHRSALIDFQSLHSASVGTLPVGGIFLHTPREYRESNTFDVLVKIGPLRSRGWGAVPDAVLTAPRFNKLVQIVWTGCQDEPDFGYDPVDFSAEIETAHGVKSTGCTRSKSWETITTQTGDAPSATGLHPDEDDFQILSGLGRSEGRRRCVLVQFGEQQGALYSPRADVLSYDPASNGTDSLAYRLPVDDLSEGMYLLNEFSQESEAGGAHAEEGQYSRVWKQHLVDRLLFDNDFAHRLRKDGIDLIHLQQSLVHWSRPATSVVHAPQRRRHFEILIRNLNIDYSKYTPSYSNKTPWWMTAWTEVTKTRGVAIQTGMNEHKIADEQLLECLNARLLEIHSEAKSNDTFFLTIPSSDGHSRFIIFYKIVAIEEGFIAPDCNLRTICNLEEIEQWRE